MTFEDRADHIIQLYDGQCDDCTERGDKVDCPYLLSREGLVDRVTLCDECLAERKQDGTLRTFDQWNFIGCGVKKGSKAVKFRYGMPLFNRQQVYRK